jgi:hypothetical protein
VGEHLPRHPKVNGLSLSTITGTVEKEAQKMTRETFHYYYVKQVPMQMLLSIHLGGSEKIITSASY